MRFTLKRRTKKIGGVKGSRAFAGVMSGPWIGMVGASGFLVTFAGLLLLVSTVQPQLVGGLRVGAANIASPVLETISMPLQTAAIFVRDVTGLGAIQAENARLSEENLKLREWYQAALLLEAENKSLRELMALKIEPQHTYITARILSDSRSHFAKSLLVSAGVQDGVQKGQAVVAGDGLIGRVVEAGDNVSRVLLMTDINSRIPVLIENSRQHAIFAGQNKQNGALIHLPPESEVPEGARIVTSGVGGVFPVGLPVGVVSESGHVVKPFADLQRLMHVRIVSLPNDPNLRQGGL